MIRLRHKLFIYALRLFDQALLVSVLLLGLDLTGRKNGTGSLSTLLQNYYEPSASIGLLLVGITWIWIFNTLVHYETNRLKTLRSQIFDVAKANSAAAFLLMMVSTVFAYKRITNEVVLAFWITTCGVGILSRIILSKVLMVVRRSGYNYRHLLILGSNEQARKMAKRIDATPVLGYKIRGFVSDQSPDTAFHQDLKNPTQIIGQIKDLKNILENEPIDEIMICVPFLEQFGTVTEVVRLAQELGVVVRLFPDPDTAKILSRCHIEQFEGDCVVTMFREQLLLQLLGKRVMDFSVSFILLLLLSPLLVVTALCIPVTLFAPEPPEICVDGPIDA